MNQKKLAHGISNFGHPLLTFPIFILCLLFLQQPLEKAIWISALIILILFIPLYVKIQRGTKSGKYSNFDISDRKERKNFYPFVFSLVFLVILILHLTQQPKEIIRPLVLGLLLILVNYALNFFIKVSLHVSLTVFLGFLIFEINPFWGVLFIPFVFLMAWSRLELKRHSFSEILIGLAVGMLIGGFYLNLNLNFI